MLLVVHHTLSPDAVNVGHRVMGKSLKLQCHGKMHQTIRISTDKQLPDPSLQHLKEMLYPDLILAVC